MELKNNIYCYVVEGKTDIDKVKKCGARFVIQTNGKFFNPYLISNLKEIAKHRQIVILTDPDPTGIAIRKKINQELNNSCLYIESPMRLSHDKKKIGIAQIKLNDLKEILKDYIYHDFESNEKIELTYEMMMNLNLIGLNSSKNKEFISKKLNINSSTSKEFLLLLQMLEVKEDDLKEMLGK